MRFRYSDGGRAKANFKGTTGDCGIRAAAVVLRRDYKEVYDALQTNVDTWEQIPEKRVYGVWVHG